MSEPFYTQPSLPEGWTIVHERRSMAVEDPHSAFRDAHQWTIYDPKGRRPPQATWPTEWYAIAVRYACAQAARRAAHGKPLPRGARAYLEPSLVPVPRLDWVAPQDWHGLPHLRPGLYRRLNAPGITS